MTVDASALLTSSSLTGLDMTTPNTIFVPGHGQLSTRQDLAEVFRLHRLGRTRVVRESRDLGDINASIDEVLKGKVSGRLVFDLSGTRA